jgi:biopolymer transport protein ExbD
MKRREPITPDLTPLIDVVFLILIFFLVSSTFKKDELALALNLPTTESLTQEIDKQDIAIELDKKSIALHGKQISFKELDQALEKFKEHTKPVNVRIDKEVTYDRIMRLFDLLKKHNLTNLALESKQKSD